MKKQKGFTLYEIIITLTIFFIFTAGTAAYVSGFFETSPLRVKTLLQHMKIIGPAFGLYYAKNLYGSEIYKDHPGKIKINLREMQAKGYIKNFNIIEKTGTAGKYSYADLKDIAPNLRGNLLAFQLDGDKKIYRNYYMVSGAVDEMVAGFYELCKGGSEQFGQNKVTKTKAAFYSLLRYGTNKCVVLKGAVLNELGEYYRGITAGCVDQANIGVSCIADDAKEGNILMYGLY